MEETAPAARAAALVAAALDAGAAGAEVWWSESEKRTIVFRDREEESGETSTASGYALRVVRDGRLGFSYLSDPVGAAGAAAVAAALASAAWGDEEAVDFPAEVPGAGGGADDPFFAVRPREEKVDLLAGIVEAVFAVSPLVRRVRRATYAERSARRGVANSSGLRLSTCGTWYSLGLSVVAGEGEGGEVADEWVGGRAFGSLPGAAPFEEAARTACALLGAGTLPTGSYAALLRPQVAAALLDVFAAALSGEMVARGKSPLAGRVGERVASPCLGVLDDPLRSGGYGSEPFDDEGVAAVPRFLVEGGVLRGWMHTLRSARRLGEPPTGHGRRRDHKSAPAPAGANLHLLPGTRSAPEMERAMGRGVVVTDILGAHTMDPISGMVSLGATGFLVEGGRRTRPFRGVTLSGNLYAMFRSVAEVGADLRWYGSTGAPSLLLEGLDISGS